MACRDMYNILKPSNYKLKHKCNKDIINMGRRQNNMINVQSNLNIKKTRLGGSCCYKISKTYYLNFHSFQRRKI